MEDLLRRYHDEIERLESRELSLEEMEEEDSAYLVADRLKSRASKIFQRLCVLRNRPPEMGGTREKRFRYSGSRYTEVNLHVQKFVNKQSLEERMPDYHDIRYILCTYYNNEYGNLGSL